MFNMITTELTPGFARKLIQFASVKHIDLAPEVIEAALQDIITSDDLNGFPLKLPVGSIQSLQYIRDWGRSILLANDYAEACNVSLANVWINPGKTVILTEIDAIADWVRRIKVVWPDATISVSGNSRYRAKLVLANHKWPEGFEITEQVDVTCDFIITSLSSVMWDDLPGLTSWTHTIVDEMNDPHAHSRSLVSRKTQHLYNTIGKELPNPVVIQNIYKLPKSASLTVNDGIMIHANETFDHVANLATHLLWCGQPPINPEFGSTPFDTYRSNRNYVMSARSYLELQGVCYYLLDTSVHKAFIRFDNVHQVDSKQSREFVERISGRDIEHVVSYAVKGDRLSLGFLGENKTHSWSVGKARHIRTSLLSVSNSSSRNILLCDNDYLSRSLRLMYATELLDYRGTTGNIRKQEILDKFHPKKDFIAKSASNILMTLDEFIDNSALLDHSTNLVISDPSAIDASLLIDLIQLCEHHNSKLIFMVDKKTPEALYFAKVLEKGGFSAK